MFGGCKGPVHSCKHFGMGFCEFHHVRACRDEVQVGDGPFTSLWHTQVPEGMKVEVVPLLPDPESTLEAKDRFIAILVPA